MEKGSAGAVPSTRGMEKGSPGAVPSTTFVQTDANTFKELVQRLTGPHDECHHASSTLHSSSASQSPASSPSSPRIVGIRKPSFKLQERRQGSRSKLTILRPNSLVHAAESPSPSSPSYTTLSNLTSPSCSLSNLLISDRETPTTMDLNKEEEEKAIKERRFYLHPSPQSRPSNAVPQLLPLFPLTSPKK